jgi:hypothetical protein
VAAAVADETGIETGAPRAIELKMWRSALLQWQQNLVTRLERALGRELVVADLDCISWNAATEALTVEAPPLLGELRSRNLISNVFRSRNPGR